MSEQAYAPERVTQMAELRSLLERTGKELFAKGINLTECANETEGPNGNEYVPTIVVDGSIMVYPATVQVKSILGEIPQWGFVIEKIIGNAGSRYEPPSEDYAEVGRFRSVWETLNAIVKLQVDLFLHYLNDSVVTDNLAAEYTKGVDHA